MLKQKILKLAKTLNIFTINDLIILEEKEENILSLLQELIKEEFIQKINDNQFVLNKNKHKTNLLQSGNIIYEFIKDAKIEEMPGYDKFVNLPSIDKENTFKYITILNACYGLNGIRLRNFIEKWNIENPNYKTAYSSVMDKRLKFNKNGIIGLTSNNRRHPNYFYKKWKDKNTKQAILIRFIELYLSDKNLTIQECLIQAAKEKLYDNYFEDIILSGKESFIGTMKKYYSNIEIDFYRKSKKEKLLINPELNLYFDKAVEKYLEFIKTQKEDYQVRKIRSLIQNNLIPIFKKYRLIDINFEVINNFIAEEQDKNSLKTKINTAIINLRKVLKHFYPDYCNFKRIMPNKNEFIIETKLKILTCNEIKLLLKNIQEKCLDLYPIVFTILTTGMFISETLVLTWDDIDFSKKQITVNKIFSNNKISYLKSTSKRIIDCPSCLINLLIEYKTNNNIVFPSKRGGYYSGAYSFSGKLLQIFNSMGFKEYSFLSLRDTHISLLIQSGMPLNHIQKLIGHASIISIISRFKSIITKKPIDEVFSFIQ